MDCDFYKTLDKLARISATESGASSAEHASLTLAVESPTRSCGYRRLEHGDSSASARR